MEFWLLIAILGGLALLAIVLYNRLVKLRQTRNNAFADIDVQLKLRYDLIPNLVETVKGYATHERTVFENITAARAQVGRANTMGERIQAEAGLGSALMNLLAVAESYPDLKASENFKKLQMELSDIENKVAHARRFFNNATKEYNSAIQQFPALVIARLFNFQQETFFDLGAEERAKVEKPVDVKFH